MKNLPSAGTLYGVCSPSDVPAYTFAETARYLGAPASTVRAWFLGTTQGGERAFSHVLQLASKDESLLSFTNLIEVYVLLAIRRIHGVKLKAVRHALTYLAEQWDSDHPLAHKAMFTDGAELFVKEYEQLVSASEHGQQAIARVLGLYLKRVERDPKGVPIKLFPVARSLRSPATDTDSPRSISISPTVQFGKPCIDSTGIPTEVVGARYAAGESIDALARDYERPRDEIEAAIRYEILVASAA